MTKIRWTLLLLAIGITLPAGLIVQRAITSLQLENSIRHEAVADRVFDEMERSLSDFLLREEDREPEDYAPTYGAPTYGAPTEDPTTNGLRPHAFSNSPDPFIVAWFRLDFSGEPRFFIPRTGDTPRVEAAMAEAFGPSTPTPKLKEQVSLVKSPAPGRTQSLDVARIETPSTIAAKQDAHAQGGAYEVFRSLNLGQKSRSKRLAKALPEKSARAGRDNNFLDTDYDAIESLRDEASVAFVSEEASDLDSLEHQLLATAPIPNASIPVHVDPFIARTTSSGDIILTRSVWHGTEVERQGVILDRNRLVVWLESRIVTETGLSDRIAIDFDSTQTPVDSVDQHHYLHRFAEPFDGLVARLDLDSLPGQRGEGPIYALALLLTLVATVGLFAVHRMTQVVVEFAERRNNFVAAVSHELKTPLTSIRMYGEMLRDGLVSSEAKRKEYYATIADESERLSRLIDNVLDFSNRERKLVVGSLSEAIRATSEQRRIQIESDGFKLTLEIEEHLPPVSFDRDGITQIVFNLVDNALKYSRDSDRREVVIGLHVLDRSGHRNSESETIEERIASHSVELSVRDFGPGVPNDQLKRIFEPFYRIGEELTRTTKGTGIGLALVKDLAQAMGAHVFGQNSEGGGFQVCIRFAAKSN